LRLPLGADSRGSVRLGAVHPIDESPDHGSGRGWRSIHRDGPVEGRRNLGRALSSHGVSAEDGSGQQQEGDRREAKSPV
jgi:hypothetical protein